MIAVICAGGPVEELCAFEPYMRRDDVVFIGADRGSHYLIERGIVPHMIVGDFDSVTGEQWAQLQQAVVQIEKVPAEKDETDTELAIKKALQLRPKELILTGVTGGRLDHYEAALRVIFRTQTIHEKVVCKILNCSNELRFLSPGRHILSNEEGYRYISFFAYVGDVCDVTLRGVKYETTDEKISRGSARFTSNEIVKEDAYIEFNAGICLMIRSTD